MQRQWHIIRKKFSRVEAIVCKECPPVEAHPFVDSRDQDTPFWDASECTLRG